MIIASIVVLALEAYIVTSKLLLLRRERKSQK